MKKIFILIFVFTTLLFIPACDSLNSMLGLCNHEWELTETIDPTCASFGKEIYTCALCGKTKSKKLSKTDHDFDLTEWVVDQEPTCIEEGIKSHHCKNCDAKIDEEKIDKIAHDISDTIIPGREANCTQEGFSDHYECKICGAFFDLDKNEIDKDSIIISKTAHSYIETIVNPTCLEDGYTEKKCSECEYTIYLDRTEKLGHNFDSGVKTKDPTTTEKGIITYTCSRCGEKTYEYIPCLVNDPNLFIGTNGRTDLIGKPNETNLLAFYDALEEALYKFHIGETEIITEGSYKLAAKVNTNGISQNEAVMVYNLFSNDHPIYYWRSITYLTYGDNTNISSFGILCQDAYADTSARLSANDSIYSHLGEYINYVSDETDPYYIAMGLHDMIIDNVNYCYEAPGIPSSAPKHHSIAGPLFEGLSVCEGYAKLFSALLNYFDVDNYYVTGDAYSHIDADDPGIALNGEGHAWNMVKMSDNKWYYCDLTWDDKPDWQWGITYNYFLVSDNTTVTYLEGGYSYATSYASSKKGFTFGESHIPDSSSEVGASYQYALPIVSSEAYKHQNGLRTTFIVDGITYALVGYKKLAIINSGTKTEIDTTNKVTYDGKEYSVVAIAKMDSDGFFEPGGAFTNNVTSLVVGPDTKFILTLQGGAISSSKLTNVSVSSSNESYSSDGYSLMSKDGSILYWFNSNSNITSYTIPSSVTTLEHASFYHVDNLDELIINSNVTNIPSQGIVCTKDLRIKVYFTASSIPDGFASNWCWCYYSGQEPNVIYK